jgi:hypothetical protein
VKAAIERCAAEALPFGEASLHAPLRRDALDEAD